ncbi:betaine--homocysteine S-methyltransferase [Ostreibacterium oceani]|uniref:Betaine--homocysteine S-methyltransferase n=1 Tax=Ostreibacterium oceani TaxID=2654998 RepID=A0A6N7F081_9GAMM|nr:betaine--homocysteine S-methyltransferase [Ostreibacterium oceani]MPV86807.1 betaine--homocysteine S-methyltransferase [Ostreibacterium oceani]
MNNTQPQTQPQTQPHTQPRAQSKTDNRFLQLLDRQQALLADGATGTNLFDMGLTAGDAPELWNLSQPEKIIALHQSFADAGADIILTNSFGANASRLKLHSAEDQVYDINKAAATIARQVADNSGRTLAVGGSIGPTGEMLFPLGTLTEDEAAAMFAAQAQGLADGGVDVIWIETMSALEEVIAAVKGAKTVGLPIVTTMSFDTHGHTMMGISPAAFSDFKHQTLGEDVTAIGCNCGVGAEESLAALAKVAPDIIKVVKANCGVPQFKNGEICYTGTVESMAEYAKTAAQSGIRVIGGCCGTTPAHLRAMRAALDAVNAARS